MATVITLCCLQVELVITTWEVVQITWHSSGAILKTLLLGNGNMDTKRLLVKANVNNLAS